MWQTKCKSVGQLTVVRNLFAGLFPNMTRGLSLVSIFKGEFEEVRKVADIIA
jgi:hypothetical protein